MSTLTRTGEPRQDAVEGRQTSTASEGPRATGRAATTGSDRALGPGIRHLTLPPMMLTNSPTASARSSASALLSLVEAEHPGRVTSAARRGRQARRDHALPLAGDGDGGRTSRHGAVAGRVSLVRRGGEQRVEAAEVRRPDLVDQLLQVVERRRRRAACSCRHLLRRSRPSSASFSTMASGVNGLMTYSWAPAARARTIWPCSLSVVTIIRVMSRQPALARTWVMNV